jgi:hypothetical protein
MNLAIFNSRTQSLVALEDETGPLDGLWGKPTLVVADAENITLSAKNLGYTVSFYRLAKKLQRASEQCSFHAFFSSPPGSDRKAKSFQQNGWIPHARPIERVYTYHGRKSRANSDNAILFGTASLVARGSFETVIIGSGDGDLVTDLARFLSDLQPGVQVMTLSLPGSTSARVDSKKNCFIARNMEIGVDALRPIDPSHYFHLLL